MPTEPTAGKNKVNPDDLSTSSGDATEKKIQDLEERVISLERLIMRMLDKLELDYPGIGF